MIAFTLLLTASAVWATPYATVITGQVTANAGGAAYAGGSAGVQTYTESLAEVRGLVYADNLGTHSGYQVSAGFDNFAHAVNGGNGPSSATTSTWGTAGITAIPPSSLPQYHHSGS